jgi:ubiquinone/menaquinone biosynthesis C-methylase UbiE
MKHAEYSKIANRYDKNPIRHNQPKEKHIEELLKLNKGKISILDLACGTGNYLKAQQQYFKSPKLHWYGCDLSEGMLKIAKKKVRNVDLKIADAAKLPYPENHFDLIACNWAFQHFANKSKAVLEIHRTLKTNGILVMKNISPEMMPMWWVYTFFASSKKIDKERFWNNKKLFLEFEKIGFKVELKIDFMMKRKPLKEIYFDVKNRDTSHLTMISETEYQTGMKKIKKMRKKDYLDQFTYLEFVGRKK